MQWALAQLLNSPELELRYVLTAGPGLHEARAKIVAKMLEIGGQGGVPIGLGCDEQPARAGTAFEGEPELAHGPWVDGYDLSAYAGEVHEDGVGELVRMVMASEEPLTVIAIGPLGNIGEALSREPRIAPKLHFVGMQGAVYRGYASSKYPRGRPVDPVKGWEYNVWADIPSSQTTFAAPWASMTITPLDTCGLAKLSGAEFARIRDSPAPLARAVMENDRIWHPRFGGGKHGHDLETESSVLFDCVA